jgi:hypothetical protein
MHKLKTRRHKVTAQNVTWNHGRHGHQLLTILHEILNIPFAGQFGTIWNLVPSLETSVLEDLEEVVVIGKSVWVFIDS